ncbi:DUF4292 domain-containing protein [Chlorobium phaeovibrioides]|uniref:DUF4292 domain-containing protein n=2 Tax=Chlorobium phaeovibrioides TaxID=1094 RepID=A0A432AXT3_CHLPH|nr:DUF4292 domain-containing protein [Chlorobium phaeovibrioides]MWV53748.1 DUF4292 domain-containing protein [Chlorobium phaeovibrioides]RTY37394.1 DUF4292 domain-containing protein [Chlorobium phaeovibrioides]RTY39888.1 DUF4292 domain-containing protein [Chlorobium phaeovibrioides]HCD36415.1 DUF4292 domain-containing protein [Chlorobium sp.]
MMKKKGFVFCMVLLMLSGWGCSGFRTVSRTPLPADQAALVAEYRDLYGEVTGSAPFIRSVDGYADVWLSTPKERHKVFCNIRVNRGLESRMIVSAGILGIPVADLFIGRDSVAVHDMLRNRYFIGASNDRNLEKILGVGAASGILGGSLLGLVDIMEPPENIISVKKGEGLVSFRVRSGAGCKVVVVDVATRTLRALMIEDSFERVQSEVHFRDFESCSVEGRAALVPRTVSIVLPGKSGPGESQLVISYDERVFNARNGGMKMPIPEGARVVSLDETASLPWM